MEIPQLPFLEVAKEYGTPLYVNDLGIIADRHRELTEAFTFPTQKILYAMKANFNPSILRFMHELGVGIDTVSPAEVLLAKTVGFPPDRILFTSNNSTTADLALIHSEGVLCNIDSISILKRFGELFPGSQVCLRFNPDVVAGAHPHIQTGGELTKFGILFEYMPEVLEVIKTHSLRVVGIHEHTGSGISDMDAYLASVKNLLAIATPANFPELRFVNLGGGLGVPYRPEEKRLPLKELGAKVSELFARFCKDFGRSVELWIEPGRYLVAESGVLLTQVTAAKQQGSRIVAGTDSGFNHLIRPILYDAYHHIVNLTNPAGAPKIYDVVGNICETGDCFARDRSIATIREGDILAILNAGAYGASMSSIYNLRPLAAEITVQSKQGKMVTVSHTPRRTHQELVSSILRN